MNRDRFVNSTDVLLARNNQTNLLNALKLLDLSDGEAALPATSLDELAWLYDYGLDGSHVTDQPPEKQDANAAVDSLLASFLE